MSVTPFHWIKAGLCFEFEVPDVHTYTAIQAAGAAGTCAQDMYAHFEKDVTQELPGFGDVEFKVYTKGAALQELYGSSHSYLQNLYGSSHSLQNLNWESDFMNVAKNKNVDALASGAAKDAMSGKFPKMNMGTLMDAAKDKNVDALASGAMKDFGFQELYGSSHSYLQNLYGSSHSLQNMYGSSHSYLI